MIPVVMLTMNGIALTKQAVESVLAQDIDVHLVVIDNKSTDGTLEYLRTLDPEHVTVMALAENVGVSAAWNLALRQVFDRERAQAAVVCNNDIEMRPETVRVLTETNGEFVTCVGEHDRDKALNSPWSPQHRPNPDFSLWRIRRSCWMKVGEFDEGFQGAYGEDWDYHVRMHKAGIEAFTCGLPFYHVASGTIKSAPNAERRRVISDQAERNREYFFRKWGVRGGSPEYYALFRRATPCDTNGTTTSDCSNPC